MKDGLKNKFMSAFGIFALILTIAYIIYFIVVIVRDVAAGRKSGDDSSQTETFDTSFMEEQSVQVTEPGKASQSAIRRLPRLPSPRLPEISRKNRKTKVPRRRR